MSSDADRRLRFERVADEVYEPLQRYLRRRAGAADAADALAESLTVVWRRIDDVPDEPLAWCYGVARRCLANQRRGESRRLRLVDRLSAVERDRGAVLDPQLAIDAGDPALVEALSALTPAEREVVHLWAWEQLEAREIAVVLDTTANAVSVALTRAKRKLAERLDRDVRHMRQDRAHSGQVPAAGTDEWKGDGR